jgi:uncharacterized membrane protein YoaK (UPF0700 family)
MVLRSIPSGVLPLLSFVAGYVDGCIYLALFGLFVAQVTGSFVLTGAQFVTPSPGVVVKLMGIPVFFLAGMATTVIVSSVERRARDALPPALALEAVLLTCLLVSWIACSPFGGPICRRLCPQVCAGFRRWVCRAHWCVCWCRALPPPM